MIYEGKSLYRPQISTLIFKNKNCYTGFPLFFQVIIINRCKLCESTVHVQTDAVVYGYLIDHSSLIEALKRFMPLMWYYRTNVQ